MELLIFSFVAGLLTLLAPCILPLLPVIIGGSVLNQDTKPASLKHPLIIITSLVVSVVIFTLLLKSTTILLGIPTLVWMIISGSILILFGINLLFPALWETFMLKTGLAVGTNKLLGASQRTSGIRKDIFLGAALGPVFNSCSPTYALIVATILPASFITGVSYLVAYALGMGSGLLLVAFFGRALVTKVKWLANPRGAFQKSLGVIFILVGMAIIFGVDKQIQTFVLEQGWYDPIMKIEQTFE